MKCRGRGSIPVSQYRRMEFTQFTSLPGPQTSSLQLHRAVLGLLTWGGNIDCAIHNLVTTTTSYYPHYPLIFTVLMLTFSFSLNIMSL